MTNDFEPTDEQVAGEPTEDTAPVNREDPDTGHIFGPIEDKERGRGRPTKLDPLTIEKTAREESMEKAAALVFRLQQGNMTKRQEQERKEQFLKALADLEDIDFRQFMGDEEVQKVVANLHLVGSTGKPGDPIFDEKGREVSRVPWSAQAQMEVYDMVKWMPMRTETIEVNGVAWRVYEGIENETPNIIRDVAMESYRNERAAVAMQREVLSDSPSLFADGTTFQTGWGGKQAVRE